MTRDRTEPRSGEGAGAVFWLAFVLMLAGCGGAVAVGRWFAVSTSLGTLLAVAACLLAAATGGTAGGLLRWADRHGYARGLKDGMHLGRHQLLIEQRARRRQRVREAIGTEREAQILVTATLAELDDLSGGEPR